MAGIPSAVGAGFAPSWLARALIRIGLLVGLVVAGWLLGTASATAAEDPGTPSTIFAADSDPAPSPAPANLVNSVPVVGTAVSHALPALSRPLAPALPPLSLPGSQLDTELSRGLETALSPAADVPEPSAPDPALSAAPRPSAPAPAALGAPAGPEPAAALHPVPAPQYAPVTPAPTTGDVTGTGRQAGSDAVHPVAPVRPLQSTPAPADTGQSCPPGGSGSGATTHSAHFVTLDDQHAGAGQAVAQRPSYGAADGVPSWYAQRPTTSPD